MKVCKGSLQEVLVQRSCQIPSIRSFFDDCVKFSLRSWLEVLEFLLTDVFLNAVRAFLPSYDFKSFTHLATVWCGSKNMRHLAH